PAPSWGKPLNERYQPTFFNAANLLSSSVRSGTPPPAGAGAGSADDFWFGTGFISVAFADVTRSAAFLRSGSGDEDAGFDDGDAADGLGDGEGADVSS